MITRHTNALGPGQTARIPPFGRSPTRAGCRVQQTRRGHTAPANTQATLTRVSIVNTHRSVGGGGDGIAVVVVVESIVESEIVQIVRAIRLLDRWSGVG